jgi:hypothetical protein
MRIFLKIVAIFTGLAVVVTALVFAGLLASGELFVLAQSGVLGVATLVAWSIILVVGPVAAAQLWRLRQVGLFLTSLLGDLALAYYLVGLFVRAPGAPVGPIVAAILVNGAFVALLMLPAARRVCAQGR